MNSPPHIKILTVVPIAFYPMPVLSGGIIHLWKNQLAKQAVYFSGMPRSEWLDAVDARMTTQPEEGAISTSSKYGGDGAGQRWSPPPVLEKVWGKSAAENEPARKKRRMVDVAPH